MSGLAAESGTKYLFGPPVPKSIDRPLTRSGCGSNITSFGSSISMRLPGVRMRYNACTEIVSAGVTTIRTSANSMLLRLISSSSYRVAATASVQSSWNSKALAARRHGAHQIVLRIDRPQRFRLAGGLHVDRLRLDQHDLPPGAIDVARLQMRHGQIGRLADAELFERSSPSAASTSPWPISSVSPVRVQATSSLARSAGGGSMVFSWKPGVVTRSPSAIVLRHVDSQRFHAAVEHVVVEVKSYLTTPSSTRTTMSCATVTCGLRRSAVNVKSTGSSPL